MTSYRRGPRALSLALGDLQEALAPRTLLGEVQRVWREVVGPSISEHAQPVSERNGTVTVSCSASVWAQELDLMSPVIVARLNELLNEPPDGAGIGRLRCVATPPSER